MRSDEILRGARGGKPLTTLLMLLCACAADAQPSQPKPVHLTWTPPTTNTNGTPLTNLAGFRVYWGTAPSLFPNSVSLANPGLTAYDVSGLTIGQTYFFVVTALASTGAESAFSNTASKVVEAALPNPDPPTGLITTTPDAPVYSPFLTRNAQSMIQVGVVSPGKPCDGTQSARGFGPNETLYLVRVEDVRLFPGVAPEAVFAAGCSVPPT